MVVATSYQMLNMVDKNQPLSSKMKAMVVKKCWFSSILEQREVKMPEIKDHEVLIKVWAVGVNRDDIIDVATSVDGVCPGLECSGIIEAVGRNVSCWKVGERVCAILEGGGYAEHVAVPANFLLPLPEDIDLDDAAGLPYASCLSLLALLKLNETKTPNKTILIREGSNGIGTLAIQYAKYMGFKVIASTGSSDRFAICHHYGADFCVDHTLTNFARTVIEKARRIGVDLVLDYGASNLQSNIECCRIMGKVKIVIVDLHGMESSNIDLSILQRKQVEIKVFDLRSKDLGYKASVITEIRTHLWPAVLQQKVVPAIEYRFPVTEYQKAMNILRKDDSAGKIILCMNFGQDSDSLKMD
ncbi:uncharacterized protein [Primulina eburnea]|uniref:uncharacterized protein isoform X1 n=2 Tax=Primulina eburnea TaxID=1245227 RepID=UPI003C6C5E26